MKERSILFLVIVFRGDPMPELFGQKRLGAHSHDRNARFHPGDNRPVMARMGQLFDR